MDKKVYLLAFDGCKTYGAEIYCVGIFDDRDRAEEVKRECEQKDPRIHIFIREITLNKTYELRDPNPDDCDYYDCHHTTRLYLGGYIE